MATLLDLVGRGTLVKLDPALDSRVQEDRIIYLSLWLRNWLETELPTMASDWSIESTPAEQLDALVARFASGEVLTFRQHIKPLNSLGSGIWELKTQDLRVFGWFPQRDCFIGHKADNATRIKAHRLYPGYVNEVVRFRNALDLDEPKFLQGVDPRAVVSNFDLA